MYKVLIVDDEKAIRNGLAKMISWKELGVSSVFTAADGMKALEIIKIEKPSILITDICMHEVNGLELIERSKKYNPHMISIVLTGHDDFKYIQRGIRLQIKRYLLKPVDENELTEFIKQQIMEFEQEKKSIKRQHQFRNKQGIAQHIKLEEAMLKLTENNIRQSKMEGICFENNYNMDQEMTVALISSSCFSDKNMDSTYISLTMKDMCIRMLDLVNEGITFYDKNNNIVLALFGTKAIATKWIAQFEDIIKDEFLLTDNIFVGSCVSGFMKMPDSYNVALEKMHKVKISDEKILNKQQLFDEEIFRIKQKIVKNFDKKSIVFNLLEEIANIESIYNVNDSVIVRAFYEIATTLYFIHMESSQNVLDESINSLTNCLLVSNTSNALELTKEFLLKLIEKKKDEFNDIVIKAKIYINEHLSEPLSVTSIAKYLFVSPTYFSRLFKKTTEVGCNEYITKIRIEKAKSLLEMTTYKSTEIAFMVGYSDKNYFSLAFKKYTNMTPTEYRRLFK